MMISNKIRASVFALALILGLALLPSPAEAQQRNRQANFGNLISALNNINVQVDELTALNDLLTIGDITIDDINVIVVNVEDVLNGNNVRALNNVLRNVDIDIQDVLNDLTITDVIDIVDVLNDAKVVVNDVVAINVLSGGDLLVFTR